jgi:hypothetical protein
MNRIKKAVKILIIGALLPSFLTPAPPSLAADFNPNYIISDSEMLEANSITLEEVQAFLKIQGGALATYIDPVTRRSAAEIIWQSAESYGINPKFLLVLLQKEQSLVTDSDPKDTQYKWAMGFALCDDCEATDPRVAIFAGFTNQVDRAAWRFRWFVEEYKKGTSQWLKYPRETFMIDGVNVTPSNQVTAALYNYTPHYTGNYNFWRIWNNWFATVYPDGALLRDKDTKKVYLIQGGKKRLFASNSVLKSGYDTNKIIDVTSDTLDNYDNGNSIKFAQYSLLRSPKGTVYLLVNDERRGIASKAVFKNIGFNPEEVEDVTFDELNNYKEGNSITMKSIFPLGGLLQDKKTGGVYYVENGNKYPIYSKEIMLANFKGRRLTGVSTDELAKYPTLEPIKFKDGEIIQAKDSEDIYVISNGERRLIPSATVFDKLGYKKENIIKTSLKALEIHPLGQPINLTPVAPVQVALNM